jgi:hypothetical protein
VSWQSLVIGVSMIVDIYSCFNVIFVSVSVSFFFFAFLSNFTIRFEVNLGFFVCCCFFGPIGKVS